MKTAFFTILLFLGYNSFCQFPILIPYHHNGKWGFCDTLANVLVKPKYEKVDYFWAQDKLSKVVLNKKIGIFDRSTMKEFIPTIYDKIEEDNIYVTKTLLYKVTKNKKIGYINSEGSIVLPTQYEDVNFYTYKNESKTNILFSFKLKKKWGLKNEVGTILLIPKYDKIYKDNTGGSSLIGVINNMEFNVSIEEGGKLKEVFSTKQYEDSNNQFEIEPAVESVKHPIDEYKTRKVLLDQLILSSRIDSIYNDTIISRKYFSNALWYQYGEYFKIKKNGKIGIINARVLNRSIMFFEKTYDKFLHIIDFEDPSSFFLKKYGFEKLFIVNKKGKIGIINEQEKVIYPFSIDKIIYTNDSFILFEKNKKQGTYIYYTNYKPIEAKYDTIEYYTKIKINQRSSFLIFQVTDNGIKKFVGENGVEYFK